MGSPMHSGMLPEALGSKTQGFVRGDLVMDSQMGQ